MVVEDEFASKQIFEETSHQEDQVGRIAGVDDVEAACEHNPKRQREFPEQRDGVLDQISLGRFGLERKRVTVDAYAFEFLVGGCE